MRISKCRFEVKEARLTLSALTLTLLFLVPIATLLAPCATLAGKKVADHKTNDELSPATHTCFALGDGGGSPTSKPHNDVADSAARQEVISAIKAGQDKNMDQWTRSNAKAYWALMTEIINDLVKGLESQSSGSKRDLSLQILKDLVSHLGVVAGDTHQGNANIAAINRRLRFTNVDLDDVAFNASVFIDYVHYHLISQLKSDKISSKELMTAYTDGLTGQAMDVPKAIQKILNMSFEEYQTLVDERAAKKLNKNGKIKANEMFEKLDPKDAEQMKRGLQKALKAIDEFKDSEVVDVVRKVVDRGGGVRVLRLLVSLRMNDGAIRLYEVKGVEDSGVAVSYPQTKDNFTRLRDGRQFFFFKAEGEDDKVQLEFDEHLFSLDTGKDKVPVNMRRDTPNLFEIADPKDDYKAWLEVTLYIAHMYGRAHAAGLDSTGGNARAYAALFESKLDATKDLIKELRDQYYKEIIKRTKLKN